MKSTQLQIIRKLAVVLALAGLFIGNKSMAQGGHWVEKTPMPGARQGMAAGVLSGMFWSAGGVNNTGIGSDADVFSYDPASNTWIQQMPLPIGRIWAAAGILGGWLYVTGGQGYSDIFSSVEAYDPDLGFWVTTTPMPGIREGQACAVANGILYVMGGWDGGHVGRTQTLWAYDPATRQWTQKKSMPTGRDYFTAATVNGIIYAIGGEVGTGVNHEVATVEAYDPATDTWTTKAPMPTARLGLGSAVMNGMIYAVGGATERGFESTGEALATVEAYDPVANKWTTKPPMPTPRMLLGVGSIGNVLYAAGGRQSNRFSAVLEAFTDTPIVAPPTVGCSGSLVLECTNGGAVGTVVAQVQDTNGFALQVIWTLDGVPAQTNTIPASAALSPTNVTFTADFLTGTHTVVVSASNGLTNAATCSTTVTVHDTTPPLIVSVMAKPDELWPPNHQMVEVNLKVVATDNCDPVPTSRIITVTSSDPPDKQGPDWIVNGPLSVWLRAERSDKDSMRIYTITVQSTDASGNASVASVEVTVPHDQGQHHAPTTVKLPVKSALPKGGAVSTGKPAGSSAGAAVE